METSTNAEAVSPQDFHKLSQTIGSNIQKISLNVSSMQKLINPLKTLQDSHDVKSQFYQIQNYTEQLAKDTSGLLKIIMAMPLSSPDHRQNKLSRERLSEEFMSALNLFQATQRSAAKIVADDVKKTKAQNIYIGDPFAIGAPQHQLIEMEASAIRKQEQLQIQSEEEIRQLEEQEREVSQLESNITSVNNIFKDIAVLVHNQAETVDSIEAHIDHAAGFVESGNLQLHSAANSQNKLRKKKIFMILILAIIIMILVIVFLTR